MVNHTGHSGHVGHLVTPWHKWEMFFRDLQIYQKTNKDRNRSHIQDVFIWPEAENQFFCFFKVVLGKQESAGLIGPPL